MMMMMMRTSGDYNHKKDYPDKDDNNEDYCNKHNCNKYNRNVFFVNFVGCLVSVLLVAFFEGLNGAPYAGLKKMKVQS